MNKKIIKLQKQINSNLSKIQKIQSECNHPNIVSTESRTDDEYSSIPEYIRRNHCLECDLIWYTGTTST